MKTASLISAADESIRWLGLNPLQADHFDFLSTTALTSEVFALGGAPAGGSEAPAPLWSSAAPAAAPAAPTGVDEVVIVTGDDGGDSSSGSAGAASAGPSGGDLQATSTVGEGSTATAAAAAAPLAGSPDSAAISDPQENNNGTGTAAVAASGSQFLDGLLSGSRWNSSDITYSDPSTSGGYAYTYDSDGDTVSVQNEGFGQIGADQLLTAHFALNATNYTQPTGASGFSIEGFTNQSISYVSNSHAVTMRLANSSDPGTAYAWNPGGGTNDGDSWYGGSGRNPFAGDYDWHTILHEIGHAMGLSHGHTGGAYGALPAAYDSQEWSVMTYRSYINGPTSGYTLGSTSYPQTYMRLDLLALQWMYGADYTSRSGDDTYTWSPSDPDTYINGVRAIDTTDRIFLTIWDGGGSDTYDLDAYTTNITAYMYSAGYVNLGTQLSSLGGGNVASGNIYNSWSWSGNPNANLIENIYTGSGNDYIVGNDVGNYISANGGNDTAYGGDGADTLSMGDGAYNNAYGGNGADYLYGGSTADDNLYGGANDDYLAGYGGSDYLDGGTGTNTAYGGSGADVIISSGDGGYYGGSGDDTVYAGLTSTSETLDGGADVDTLYVTSYSGNYTVNLTSGGTNFGTESFVNFENLYSGSGNDTVTGTNGNNTLSTAGGSDTLYGGGLVDDLFGGADGDALYGGSGLDRLYGGTGGDYLNGGIGGTSNGDAMYGGDGADTLQDTSSDFADYFSGGTGANSIYAGGMNDVVYGDGDGDLMYAAGGGDLMYGGTGDDSMFGEAGNDTMYGGNDGDSMYGGADSDTMYGDAGADYLFGDLGSDTLYGGADNDVINSFNQNDNIYGAAGSDWFAFQVNFGVDTIQDWQDAGANQDVIMISSAIFANYTVVQTHMSQFNATTVFINAGGGYGIYVVGATVASLDAGDFYIF